jgi:lactate dehydrogenase-like 2-hydroxyacid dehydrogenase
MMYRVQQAVQLFLPVLAQEFAVTAPIVVSRSHLPGGGIARLADQQPIKVWPNDTPPTTEQLADFVGDAKVLVSVKSDHITSTFLEQCSSLRLIALMSAGYDTIDTDAVVRHGVTVSHAPGVLHEAAADLTMALILNARRLMRPSLTMLHDGTWRTLELHEMLGLDVHGAQLGIIGFGEIGSALAKRAHGFGMSVQHYDVRQTDGGSVSTLVPFDELLRTSDIISVHVPLLPSTHHLIGSAQLAMMKPTATLVNASRGPVLDEASLIRALSDGRLHSAGLDVFEIEPINDIAHPLLQFPNVFATPHIASATEGARAAMVDLAVNNVLSWLTTGIAVTPIPECRR